MLNGANVSVGQYIGRSMIPSLIGNSEPIPPFPDHEIKAHPLVIGGLLLGIPMLCFYHPPELPYFSKFENRGKGDQPSSVIVRSDEGETSTPSEYGMEADTTSAGRSVAGGKMSKN